MRNDIEQLGRNRVPGTGPLDIQRIGAGLVNETYKMTRGGRSYALRLPIAPRLHLGLDHEWEARVLDAAGAANLAPSVVYFDPASAVLLVRWIDGRPWSQEEAAQSANIHGIAGLMRRVHELDIPLPARIMSPPAWVSCYRRATPRPPQGADRNELHRAADSRLRQLAGLPSSGQVLCHGDLHALNLIDDDHSLILLDWEYAHVSEPLWDLAGWSANNDFGLEAQRRLLNSYFGSTPNPDRWARFQLLAWLYDYVCLLWSDLYLAQRRDADILVPERATQLDARLRLAAHYPA
jgi:thiamine kinase-like enzyme